MNILKDKNILLCVTGSIAAYKACEILRLLKKDGANVQVMMSKSAEEFIGVATFAALSNNEVMTLINGNSKFKNLEKDYISILNNENIIIHSIKY